MVQDYTTDVWKTTVLLHNDALVTCVIPSHVGDMVQVTGWVDSQGTQYSFQQKMGNFNMLDIANNLHVFSGIQTLPYKYIYLVVAQNYQTEASNEYIVRGNDALIECKVPSYVSDIVVVIAWIDSEANEFLENHNYGN